MNPIKPRPKKSFNYYMRALHRDIGYITIGLTLVYALSGVLLVYRNTDFMKKEVHFEKILPTGISKEDLAKELQIRSLKVEREAGGVYYFKNGSYNTLTGKADYSRKIYPEFITKMVNLHKMNGNNKLHWISTVYGGLLLFLALSSLFMYKKGNKLLRRSLITISLSVLILLVVIFAV